MPGIYHVELLLWIAPALTTGLAALLWFRLVTAQTLPESTGVSGFALARQILDAAGLTTVSVQSTPSYLGDHYESHTWTVRLSNEVYHGRSPAAVGVAAQVTGCALQHAYSPLPALLHNMAAVGTGFGFGPGLVMAVLGVVSDVQPLVLLGIALFNAAFVLQVLCLPLQWDACRRAKNRLVDLRLVDAATTADVVRVMNGSILLGLAGVLQPFATVAYWFRG